jgi:hypothetical protein
VSFDGAGLDVVGDELTAGEKIAFKLDVNDAYPTGMVLRGTVKYAEPTIEGHYRAEIEFVLLSQAERIRLGLLLKRESVLAG